VKKTSLIENYGAAETHRCQMRNPSENTTVAPLSFPTFFPVLEVGNF
jgi:hypothetical protein